MADAIPVHSKQSKPVTPEAPAVAPNAPVNFPNAGTPDQPVTQFSKGVQAIFAEAQSAARTPQRVTELPNGVVRTDW